MQISCWSYSAYYNFHECKSKKDFYVSLLYLCFFGKELILQLFFFSLQSSVLTILLTANCLLLTADCLLPNQFKGLLNLNFVIIFI